MSSVSSICAIGTNETMNHATLEESGDFFLPAGILYSNKQYLEGPQIVQILRLVWSLSEMGLCRL